MRLESQIRGLRSLLFEKVHDRNMFEFDDLDLAIKPLNPAVEEMCTPLLSGICRPVRCSEITLTN